MSYNFNYNYQVYPNPNVPRNQEYHQTQMLDNNGSFRTTTMLPGGISSTQVVRGPFGNSVSMTSTMNNGGNNVQMISSSNNMNPGNYPNHGYHQNFSNQYISQPDWEEFGRNMSMMGQTMNNMNTQNWTNFNAQMNNFNQQMAQFSQGMSMFGNQMNNMSSNMYRQMNLMNRNMNMNMNNLNFNLNSFLANLGINIQNILNEVFGPNSAIQGHNGNWNININDFANNYSSNFGIPNHIIHHHQDNNHPISQESFQNLRRFKLRNEHCKTNEDGSVEFPNCTICFTNININETVIVLTCGHMYHSSCIEEWLTRQNTCPICRREI